MQDLIATVFLETFILLEGNGLLAADSPLKNIGLVAALIVNWGDCEKKSAIRRIVRMCKDAEIEVALGPKGWVDGVGVEKFIAGMEGGDKGEDDDMDEDEDDEDEWETEEDEDETQDAGFRKQVYQASPAKESIELTSIPAPSLQIHPSRLKDGWSRIRPLKVDGGGEEAIFT